MHHFYRLQRHLLPVATDSGLSWVLGASLDKAKGGGAVFERFTDRARRVVVFAQEEARMLGHDRIGPEHLLLGLIREGEGVAVKVLESLGIRPEEVRQRVEEAVGRGDSVRSGHIPFTSQAKDALKLSLAESRQLGHSYIGTEHLLLGIMAQGEGLSARVLTGLGADLNEARAQVIRILQGYQRREPGGQAQ